MASNKQTWPMLPGALNLLSPGDKVAPNSLWLKNWRVDQAGQLRSRRGHEVEGSGLGGPLHTIFRWGTQRWGIAGNNLRVGTNLGTFKAGGLSGEACGMVAANDFVWIADPLRRLKSRGDAEPVWDWTIAEPLSTLTAAAGAQQTTNFAEFDSSEGWDVYDPDGNINRTWTEFLYNAGSVELQNGSTTVTGFDTDWTGDLVGASIDIGTFTSIIIAVPGSNQLALLNPWPDPDISGLTYQIYWTLSARYWDPTIKISGTHALAVTADRKGRWSARKEWGSSKDTRVAGGAELDDQFHFWLYLTDPAKVDSVVVTMMDNQRRAVSCTVPRSALNPTLNDWSEIVISRGYDAAAVLAGDASYQELLTQITQANEQGNVELLSELQSRRDSISAQILASVQAFGILGGGDTFDWANVVKTQIDIEVNDAPVYPRIDRMWVVGGIATSLEGRFSYTVTYANDYQQESNPAPISNEITLAKQAANLSSIPVSPDPQVTIKHIYRIGGIVNTWSRIATILNSATTYVDTVSTEQQQYDNIPMPVDNDPPPAGVRGVVIQGGRLIVWKENRIYWSNIGKPWQFPGSDDPEEGNWNDVGESGDDIVAITQHKGTLWIYKRRSIWRCGEVEAYDPEQVSTLGAVGIRAVVNAGDVDYLVGPEGVYRFNGDYETLLSKAISPIWYGDYVPISETERFAPVDQPQIAACVIGHVNGRLYVSYPAVGGSGNAESLCYDIAADRWYQDSRAITVFHYDGQGERLMAGTSAGQLLGMEDGLTDGGAAIALAWQSAYLDQGAPDNLKEYGDLVIDFQSGIASETPATLTVQLLLNNGASTLTLGTISSLTRTSRTLAMPFPLSTATRAKNVAIRITGNASSTVIIFGAYLHYQILPRQSCSTDSQWFDFGNQLLKTVEAIEVDVEYLANGSTLDLSLESDLSATVTRTRAIAAGIRTERFLIDELPVGRRFRLRSYSTGSGGCPIIRGWRIRLRTGGEYKPAGEVWRSKVFTLDHVHLFGQVRLTYTSAAGISSAIETDLPTSMAVRDTEAVTAIGARRRIEYLLPNGVRGRQVAMAITPTAAMTLYQVEVWARPLGLTQSAAWGWMTLFDSDAEASVNSERATWESLPTEPLQ